MHILASYSWMKKYMKTDLAPEEFARLTTAAGNSVERMEDVRERFEKIVVGVIKAVKPHPNADKLRLVEVDIGAPLPARVTAVGPAMAGSGGGRGAGGGGGVE